MNGRVFVLPLIVLAAQAQASYEMMMIVDPYGDMVHRYDPENHTYLGSFGAGALINPQAVAADKSKQICYVADGAAISKFDYMTGRYLGTITTTGVPTIRQMSLCPDGNLMICDSTNVRKVNSTTGAFMAQVTPYASNTVSAAYERPNGNFWLITSNSLLNGEYVTYHNSLGTSIGYTQIKGSATGNAGTFGFGGLDFNGNAVAITCGYTGTSYNQYHFFAGTFTEAGVTVSERSYPFQAIVNSGTSNPVFGHNRMAYTMVRGLYQSEAQMYQFGLNPDLPGIPYTRMSPAMETIFQFGGYTSVTMVTAPEPSSLGLLVLGVVGFLVRKRR